MSTTMNMNERIKRYILEKEMNYTLVADRAGIDVKKFSRFMTNAQPIRIDEYELICRKGLLVDPGYFFHQIFLESKKNKPA